MKTENKAVLHKLIKKMEKRVAALQEYLIEESPKVFTEQKHLDKGKERIYWHYGYLVALKDVLRVLEKL